MNLLEFLKKEQFETEATEATASELIMKYEPIEEGTLQLKHTLHTGFSILIYRLYFYVIINACIF